MMKWAGCSPVSQREPGAIGDIVLLSTRHHLLCRCRSTAKSKAKVKSKAKIQNEELFLVQNANRAMPLVVEKHLEISEAW